MTYISVVSENCNFFLLVKKKNEKKKLENEIQHPCNDH